MAIRFSPARVYSQKYKYILYSSVLERVRDKEFILDVGCGKGDDLGHICRGRNVIGYGVDISLDTLRYGLKKFSFQENFLLIQANAESLPFGEDIFDIVMCSEVVEHLLDVNKFLSDSHRILKQGGFLFITTPSRWNYVSLIGKAVPFFLKKSLRRLVYWDYPYNPQKLIITRSGRKGVHFREFLPGELKKLLEKTNFGIEKTLYGFLRVPICPLFDRFPLLLRLWDRFDSLIGKFPFSGILKANFIIVARKV